MKLNLLLAVILGGAGGWYAAGLWHHSTEMPQASMTAVGRSISAYQCPMHPWVKSDKPGVCPVCGMNLVPIYEGGTNRDNSASGIVMLPPGSPNVAGVETVEIKKQPLVRTLHVAGMIGEDESRHGIISAPVEGRLDAVGMNCDGDQIYQGQPLANIFSRTLLNAASNYKQALKTGGTNLETARKRLEQYGLVKEQIAAIPMRQDNDNYFGLLSRLTGTVVKSYVSEGQYVKEGDRLFEIADLTRMWFMFTAYEQDLPLIHKGQMVTIHTPSLPGETLKARVSFVNPNLDEATRSAQVRVVLENPKRRIKNNTFAEGVLEADAPEVLVVPRNAVLRPGMQPRVYVEKSPGAYQQRIVKLGLEGDDGWEVLDGLKEGERVVVAGNMLIDGQAQLDMDMQSPAADMQTPAVDMQNPASNMQSPAAEMKQ